MDCVTSYNLTSMEYQKHIKHPKPSNIRTNQLLNSTRVASHDLLRGLADFHTAIDRRGVESGWMDMEKMVLFLC